MAVPTTPPELRPCGRPRAGARRRRLDDAGRVPLVGMLRLPVGFVGAETRPYSHTCAVPCGLVWFKAVQFRKVLRVSSLQESCATLDHHRTQRNNVGLPHQYRVDPRNQNDRPRHTGRRQPEHMRSEQLHRLARSQRPRSIRIKTTEPDDSGEPQVGNGSALVRIWTRSADRK